MIAPRLSRGLCLLVGLGLLAGACSPKPAATTTPTQSPSAGAVSPTVPASPTAIATTPSVSPTRASAPSPTTKPSPTPSRPAPATPATAPSTPAVAAVSLPKLGTYVYDLAGTTQSPLLGIAQPYQAGATLTIDVDETNPQAGGTEVGFRGTTSQDQVQTTTKQVYQGSRVVLTLTNLTFLGLASYDCSYVPPPEVLPIPLQAGTVPAQLSSPPSVPGIPARAAALAGSTKMPSVRAISL